MLLIITIIAQIMRHKTINSTINAFESEITVENANKRYLAASKNRWVAA